MATICTNAFGEDFVIEFDYRITQHEVAARVSGPPEDCYPAEAMEYEVTLESIRRDLPGIYPPRDQWASPELYDSKAAEHALAVAPLDVPEWLKDVVETWLETSHKAYIVVCEEEC